MTENTYRGVSLHVGGINGKRYDLGVRGFGSGALTFTLLEVTSVATSEYAETLKEVGSTMEVVRVPGSEAYELILTPTED